MILRLLDETAGIIPGTLRELLETQPEAARLLEKYALALPAHKGIENPELNEG